MANSLDELDKRVRIILDRFRQYKLLVHVSKCVLGVPEIEFLGHIVSAAGIKLSDSKRAGLVSIPVPVDRASLQAFIGLTNYFRDFVSHYAIRVYHLSKLLSPKVPFL